jgi:hypothetical protein
MGGVGSGMHRGVSWAFTRLVADRLAGSNSGARRAHADLKAEVAARGRPGAADGVVSLIDRATAPIRPHVSGAYALPDGHAGDVELRLHDGGTAWIEIKASWTKAFVDLIQTDWVRDATNTVRWLLDNDRRFAALISPATAASLRATNVPSGWSFADCWLADVALLPTTDLLNDAGVTTSADLQAFLESKWLVHWAYDGVRSTRLADIPAVAAVYDGASVRYRIGKTPGTQAAVWVGVDGFGGPTRGEFLFVYYVGYPNVLGRHNATHRLIPDNTCLVAR